MVPFISLRLWQPVSATETEVLSWFAVDATRPAPSRPTRTRPTSCASARPGMFEQDDVENWTSITNDGRGPDGRSAEARHHHGSRRRRRHGGQPPAMARPGGPTSATASTTSAPCSACGRPAWSRRPRPPSGGSAPAAVTAARPSRAPSGERDHHDVSCSSAEEAELLDATATTTGSTLLTDDVRYRMPVPVHRAGGRPTVLGAMDHFDEDLYSLRKRVERLEGNHAWTEDPPSRTRRFVTNVRWDRRRRRRGRGAQLPPAVPQPRRHQRARLMSAGRRTSCAATRRLRLAGRNISSTRRSCARRTWPCSSERARHRWFGGRPRAPRSVPPPVELANEYASVQVRTVRTGNGVRLEISSARLGRGPSGSARSSWKR